VSEKKSELQVEELKDVVREQIGKTLRELFSKEMDAYIQHLLEGEFYKELVFEMKKGLDDVYGTLNGLKGALNTGEDGQVLEVSTQEANAAFREASDQLESIVRATEQATGQIMDAAERGQERIEHMEKLIEKIDDPEIVKELREGYSVLNNEFLNIITGCSFQDITGQRIKKVVDAIKVMEDKLLTIMVSAGVKIKGKEEGRDLVEIEAEKEKAINLLKGPQEGVSQDNVDSLLADLGL